MRDKTDILVVGGGPAGLSAAITARARGKKVVVITNDYKHSKLYKSERVDNYPGLPQITGKDLLDKMNEHAISVGVEIIPGRVNNIMPMSEKVMIGFGTEIITARAVILALGIVHSNPLPGENELLGAGVSYCATCDGMLYRKRRVCVFGFSSDAVFETNHLKSIGCEPLFVTDGREIEGLGDGIEIVRGGKYEILGEKSVTAVLVDGKEYPCEGVFILRETIAMTSLLPELVTDKGHVVVDGKMKTSVQSIFAAGDCVGAPYQISKATGEGLIAALSAAEFIK